MFLRGCKWLAKNIRRLQEKHREESKSTSRLPEVRAEMYREIDKSMLEEIFKSFYDLKTNERQTKFICRHVAEKETSTYLGSDKQPASKTC